MQTGYFMGTFHNIKNLAIRNLARGLMSTDSQSVSHIIIDKIRKKSSTAEIYSITQFILDNPLRHEVDFQNNFPKKLQHLSMWRRLTDISYGKELMFQVAIINKHKDLLVENIKLLSNLNDTIIEKKYTNSIDIIREIIEKFGYSHVLFKKIAYLNINAKKCDEVDTFIKSFISKDGFKTYSSHYYNFYELFDPREGYFKVRNKWLKNTSILEQLWWKDLFYSNLFPFCYSENQFSRRLLTYGMLSTFDVLCLIKAHSSSSHFSEVFPDLERADQLILSEINSVWDQEFGGKFSYEHLVIDKTKDMFLGGDLYRNSLAFLEYTELTKWRSSLDMYYQNRIQNNKIEKDVFSKLILRQSYFQPTLKLKDLCSKRLEFENRIDIYENKNENVFIRTVAVMHCLSNGQSLTDLNQTDIQLLLSITTELSQLLSRNELELLIENSKADNHQVISFLAICMLYQSNPNDDLEYDLRYAFQIMLIEGYNHDLIKFLDWLHDKTPELSNIVGQLCDIAFIERLYLLISSFTEVLEMREKVCIWIADNLNIPEFADAAKRLKIDIKIRDIKETIDDTRIYIDEIRFKLWAEENLVDNLQRIQRSELTGYNAGISFGKNKDVLGKNTHLGSSLWMMQSCQYAFEEFCSNKIYGINSYLGRRIRHGTLDGFLMVPVVQLFNKINSSNFAKHEKFLEQKEQWFNQYREIINTIRDEYLFFNSKDKPKGLFSVNVLDTKERLDIFNDFHSVILSQLSDGFSAQDVAILFSIYCWQCLQTDLLKVKSFIHNTTITQVKKLTDKHFNSHKGQDYFRKFRYDLDQLTSTQLTDFGNWFEKPESVAISATIRELSDTVLSELKGYFPDFKPNLYYEDNVDFDIYGRTSHTLYDCLFVLLGNAAKHGKSDGNIKIVASAESEESGGLIRVSISSEHNSKEISAEHNSRINKAMTMGDLSEAMIDIGFTGLRRVRKIVREEWIVKNNVISADNSVVHLLSESQVTFTIQIPVILL
jgi:hypothetical protein